MPPKCVLGGKKVHHLPSRAGADGYKGRKTGSGLLSFRARFGFYTATCQHVGLCVGLHLISRRINRQISPGMDAHTDDYAGNS